MNVILDLFASLFPIVAPIGLGTLCRRFGLFNAEQSSSFRTLAVKVTVPFLIFKNLSKADLDAVSQALPVSMGFLVISLLFALSGLALARRLFADRRHISSYVFATFVGNYAFLGWGVLFMFWGEAALTRAVFFSMFFWPGFILIGFWLVRSLGGPEQEKQVPILKLLIKNASIPIGTIALSLTCNFLRVVPPKPIWLVIEQFAGITVPLILFAIGVSLRVTMPRRDLKVVLLAAAHRLVLGGLIGWLAASFVSRLFTVDPLTMKVIFLQAAMPTATMSPFFAEYTDMDEGLLGSIIAVATLLSLVTLPLWRIFLDGWYV